jgi:hypothetical protein
MFALALMAAEPPAAAPKNTPAATAPKTVPDEPVPAGAPSDDYGLVKWCTGALTGHMTLYKQVKPELDALPDPRPQETAALDAAQTQAGREYLELYRKATEAAEKASPRPIGEHGLTEMRRGNAMWNTARSSTDRKAVMWTWLGWELPGRCETAAERLYEKSLLSAQALGIDLIGGASAASQKPVTPQIEPPAPKAPASKTSASKDQATARPVQAKTIKAPPEPPIEDKIQAEIDGRPLRAPLAGPLTTPAG